MCDEAVDDFLPALNVVHDLFVTNKMVSKLFTALYADGNILYFDNILYEDSGNVVFNCNEVGILNIDLNNINLDNNFDEDDPGTINHFRLWIWHIKCEKHKCLWYGIPMDGGTGACQKMRKKK